MGIWSRHILPRGLDRACGIAPITRQRAKVVPRATGRVVEIGIGSGLNLPHYDAARITEVIGVDPDAHIWARAQDRVAAADFPVSRIGLSGESVPLPDGHADTVVCTYSLCTIPDPAKAVSEMHRLLAPGGRLLFTEHGRAPDAGVARWQSRLDPVWKRLAGGCHMGRDIPAIIAGAGFAFPHLMQGYIPGPRVLSYTYWGEATAR